MGPDVENYDEPEQGAKASRVGVDPLVMPEFSQGVCEDGAAILMDGKPLTIEEILERLRCGACDKINATRYRKLLVKNWTERGTEQSRAAADCPNKRLVSECLSEQALMLCYAIERAGADTLLTECSIIAGELRKKLVEREDPGH